VQLDHSVCRVSLVVLDLLAQWDQLVSLDRKDSLGNVEMWVSLE
jgi:hypothetical protein